MSGPATPKPPSVRTAARRAGTALRRSRLKTVRPLRLRLIDAVALAAGGLLLLKLLTMTQAGLTAGADLPEFGRVVAKARTGYEPPDPVTTGSVGPKEAEKAAEKPPEPPQAQPPMPPEPVSKAERALLEKLGARRDALKQRSEELDLREKMLNEAERKLENGLGDLKRAEDKVESVTKTETTEKEGLKSIVTMYETMKPKDAARVFDRLGHDVLVPLVVSMNPRKMAEILAVMQADSAERLTVALANRARGINAPQAQAGAGLPPGELPAIDPRTAR